MSVFEFDVSEQLSLYELEVQGNKFDGLEFDCVLTDCLFLYKDLLLTDISLIEDGFDIVEDFYNHHHCGLFDSLSFSEDFVIPARVLNSFTSIVTTPGITPVKLYWVAIDVLHGPDRFYEECIDTMYLYSMDMIANLFFDTMYDDFSLTIEPPYQTFIDVARIMRLMVSDLSVFSCVSVQEYFFNNICDERFFIYPVASRGFPHLVADRFSSRESVQLAHTRTVDEALALVEACGNSWLGQETIAEALVSYDGSIDERYYDHLLAESVAFVVANDAYSEIALIASEELKSTDTLSLFSTQYHILMESLIASEVASLVFACFEDAADSFGVDQEALCRQLFSDIVLDSCAVLASSDFSIGVFENLLESLISYDTIEDQHVRV